MLPHDVDQVMLHTARHIEVIKGPPGELLHRSVILFFLVSNVHIISLLMGKS